MTKSGGRQSSMVIEILSSLNRHVKPCEIEAIEPVDGIRFFVYLENGAA